MGQTVYMGPSGGSGGTNYWQFVGGVLSPNPATTVGLTTILAQIGQFSLEITNAMVAIGWQDGAGNQAAFSVQANKAVGITVNAAGKVNLLQIKSSVVLQSSDAAGYNSQLNIYSSLAQIESANAAANEQSVLFISPSQSSLETFDTTANLRAGILNTVAQFSAGIKSLVNSQESLFVAFPSSVAMYVEDAAGDIGEALQTVNKYSESFNGATIWSLLGTGEIETNQLTIAATPLPAAFVGTMEIADIGGVVHTIPLLS